MRIVLLMILSLCVISCSDDAKDILDSIGGDDTNAMSTALDLAGDKIDAVVPDTSGVAAFTVAPMASVTTEWTTGSSTYSPGGDFGDTPRGYVLIHGDKTAQSSLNYRLSQILENLCLFNTALPSTLGVPNLSAANTVTLTAALKETMSTECGVDPSQMPPDDTIVGFQVEDISGEAGSQYERKVSFDLSGGTSFTDFFYFTINTDVVRFYYIEDGSNASVALFEYDVATKISKFEFNEENTGSFKLHYRGILSENDDLGRFIAFHNNSNGDTLAVASTVENGADELHISYSYDDVSDTNDFTDGNACIDTSDFSIATDNTLSCATGAITGVASSAFTADMAQVTSANILAVDETTVIQFDSLTTVLTSASAVE